MKRILSRFLFSLAIGTAVAQAEDTGSIDIQDIQITTQSEVRFPGTMRVIGVKEGKVSLVVGINSQGELYDTMILESSRKAFVKSAVKSLAEWEFQPALADGKPIDSALRIDFDFQVDHKLAWQSFQAPGPASNTRSDSEERPVTTASFGELDSIPLPLEIVEPQNSEEGKATIEFYIDELGRVRCPRVVAGSNLVFGKTMLETVVQWKFEPPVANGTLTNTLVRQSFSYSDGKLTAARAR